MLRNRIILANKRSLAAAVCLALPSIIVASCTPQDAEPPAVEMPTTAAQYRLRANRAAKEHQWPAAERFYHSAIAKAEANSANNDDGLELAGILNEFGDMCEKSRDWVQAKSVSTKSSGICQKAIDDPNFSKRPKEIKDNWLTEKARATFVLADTERELGDYPEAESNYQQTFALRKQLGDRLKDLALDEEYEAFKRCLVRQRHLDSRITMQNRRQQWKNEHHYEDYMNEHEQLQQAMSAGNVSEVERQAGISMRQSETRFGKRSTQYEEMMRELAGFYRSHNLYDKAIALFDAEVNEVAAELPKKKARGVDAELNEDIELLRLDLVAMADIYTEMKKRDLAMKALERAIAFTKMQDRDTSLELGNLAGLIANQYAAVGHAQVAEKQYKLAMKLKLARCGNKSIEYATALCNLGGFYVSQHRMADAKPLLEEARGIFSATTDGDTTTRGYICQTLGSFLFMEGKYDQAVPFMRESVEQIKQWGSPKETAAAWYYLGLCCHNARQMNEAVSSLEEAVRIYNERGLPSSNELIGSCLTLAQCYCELHQEKRAEPLLLQAIAASRAIHDERLENMCQTEYKKLLQKSDTRIKP